MQHVSDCAETLVCTYFTSHHPTWRGNSESFSSSSRFLLRSIVCAASPFCSFQVSFVIVGLIRVQHSSHEKNTARAGLLATLSARLGASKKLTPILRSPWYWFGRRSQVCNHGYPHTIRFQVRQQMLYAAVSRISHSYSMLLMLAVAGGCTV